MSREVFCEVRPELLLPERNRRCFNSASLLTLAIALPR